ncbi:unnamed protein product [Prunus armeniaca]
MATIRVNLLWHVGMVSRSRNYQLLGGCRHRLCPLLPFLLPMGSLHALGRLSHILPKGCYLGQKLSFGSRLHYGPIAKEGARG